MENVFTRLSLGASWGKYSTKSTSSCGLANCSQPKSLWRRLWAHRQGTFFDGLFYCHPHCLETALRQELSHLQNQAPASLPPNRMPLGLLMVARGKLTHDQVLTALDAQRASGSGNIGEWLEKLGFLTEQEVAAALALQWGCPISSSLESNGTCHKLPLAILESFSMWPLHYVKATNTQYIAFAKRLDHAALYAIEKMLGCRVQPCVAPGKIIAGRIERLRHEPRAGEVEFRSVHDPAEIVRIATSYIAKLDAQETRLTRVGGFIWLLLRNGDATTNLIFCSREGAETELGKSDSHSVGALDRVPANEHYRLPQEAAKGLRRYHANPAYNVRLNSGTAAANVSAAKIER